MSPAVEQGVVAAPPGPRSCYPPPTLTTRGHSDSLQPLKILAILSLVAPLFIYGAIGLFRYDESTRNAEQRVSRSLRVAHEHASKVVGGAEALQDRLVDLVRGKSADELRAQEPALHA